MSSEYLIRSLLMLFLALFSANASNWLYLAKLSSVGSISDEETCEKLRGLIQRQVQICKRNVEVMDAVRRGAQLAIDECQYQFRNRRWNCSTLESVPVFGKVVTQGSCEVKTCWKAMPPFRKVGNVIKEKFDGATEVELRKVGTTKVLVPRNSQFKPHTDEDLVYLDPSPDFCEHDPRTPGIMGTAGRFCNKTSKAIDGCELMCCGRGFHTEEVEVVDRCSCKFHWCCYVKCKQCRKMVEMHTCR